MKPSKPLKAKEKLVMFFASCCYVGNIPFASGTFGSAAGLLLCWVFSLMEIKAAALAILFFTAFSIWIADRAEKIIQTKDPGVIVIDEFAGILVTLFGISFTPFSAIAGFFIFRFFDILKPYPVNYADQKLPGGWGIVIDDVLAGIYANITLRILMAIVY
jgi:phosphatidylglycerophosphatase A